MTDTILHAPFSSMIFPAVNPHVDQNFLFAMFDYQRIWKPKSFRLSVFLHRPAARCWELLATCPLFHRRWWQSYNWWYQLSEVSSPSALAAPKPAAIPRPSRRRWWRSCRSPGRLPAPLPAGLGLHAMQRRSRRHSPWRWSWWHWELPKIF